MSKAPFDKPYHKMSRTERRAHKRWLLKTMQVDVDVLRVEGDKDNPIGLDDEGMLRHMADDYNRILGKEIWIVTQDNIDAIKKLNASNPDIQ